VHPLPLSWLAVTSASMDGTALAVEIVILVLISVHPLPLSWLAVTSASTDGTVLVVEIIILVSSFCEHQCFCFLV
jgi:hypothetical protein